MIGRYKEKEGIGESREIEGEEIFEKGKHDGWIEKLVDEW